jgi:hypothetical protein
METTKEIFNDRKSEVAHYFDVICDLENNPPLNSKANDSVFFKILKSNMLLMLYNLVEATMVSGITEIYNLIKCEEITYENLSNEIKDLWVSEQTYSFTDPSFNRTTYKERVKDIINGIVNGATTIILPDTIKRNGGNLDDKEIKKMCDKHGIRYNASDDNGDLFKVKKCRNQLAHGVDSFSNFARDLTISDLEQIMNGVINFIIGILKGMEEFYKNKLFLDSK